MGECWGSRREMCNNVQGREGVFGVNFGVRVEYYCLWCYIFFPFIFTFWSWVTMGYTVLDILDGRYWVSLHFW
jgi:hypothetical protein